MTETPIRHRSAASSLRFGRDQLLDAHRELDAAGAELGPLTKILGIALALDGLAATVEAELQQAGRTTGGLSSQVAMLRRDLKSAEDELGRLRRENAALREREQAQGVFHGRCDGLLADACCMMVTEMQRTPLAWPGWRSVRL